MSGPGDPVISPTGPMPERMLFQWHVTDQCNLACRHCYQDSIPTADPPWEQLMAVLEQFRAFVSRRRTAAFPGRPFRAHITLTGGEPFLRDDLLPLLELIAADRQLFSFALLTNGTLLSPETVLRLARLAPAFVQVSIDGSPATHDGIRGAGSHARAKAGTRLLVKAGIPVYFSFTAHRGNFRDFPAIARLGRRLGAERIWSDRLVPCGAGGEKVLDRDETREFIAIMERERRRDLLRRTGVVLHRSLQFAATGDAPYRCSAGDTLVTVLPNGDVCPCRRLPIVVGNLHTTHLEEVYRTSPLFRELRDRERIAEGCGSCFYARTCGGGARCLSHAVHGTPFRADPGCWLAEQSRGTGLIEQPLPLG